MESEQLELWVKKAFWFLVDQHNFKYHGYSNDHFEFTSREVSIQIELGHKMPRIYIVRIGELEIGATRLALHWVIQYFTGGWPYEDIDFLIT
jgi:hypothetical protein